MKLPDERTLASQYDVSCSSIKRALNRMANDGIIFKKRGQYLINPYISKNESVFNYEKGSNLRVTDNFQNGREKPKIKVLSFDVERPSEEITARLFLEPEDFVTRSYAYVFSMTNHL